MENNSNAETLQICRTCMKELVNKPLFFNLDFTEQITEPTIRLKLYDCIPELDLSIIPNAIICYECANIVNSVYKFKNECLQTEMNIHKYIQQMQQTDNVDLVEVLQFHREPYGNLRTELKTEAIGVIENFKADESILCESNTYNEAGKHQNLQKMNIEKTDLHEVLFYTDANFTTYTKLEFKGNSDTYDSSTAQTNIPQVVDKQDDYIQNVGTPDMYQCYSCRYKTESKLKLIVHIKSHTAKNQHHEIASKSLLKNIESIKCEPIQRNFSTENNEVNCSYSKHNSKNQSIIICQDSNSRNDFEQDTSSKSKVQNHTSKKPFKCLVCEYHCKTKSTLKVHMQIHTGEKPFKCQICEYHYTTKSYLKVHMRIHTGEKLFKCSVCEYQCGRKTDLKVHIRIHTGEKPFKCSVCEYRFSRKTDLNVHMRIHTGEKPFKCSLCEYQCTRKNSLKFHIMQNHAGEKSFKCAVCDYRCCRKSNLKVHMRIHTGEKPFKCSICEYQCIKKTALSDHMRIHTGETPFKCSVCEYRCSRKTNLKVHMRIHTGETPFKCSACEYQCRHKSSLKTHIMRMHSK